MRILHVLHNYPPEFRGGVERYVEALCATQQARGQDVRVLCGSVRSAERTTVELEELNGVAVARIVRKAGLRIPLDPFDPETVAPYEEFLERTAPDIVHLHHWWNLSDDLVRRAAALGRRVVVTLHDAFTTCCLFFRMPDGRTPCDRSQSPESCVPCVGDRFGLDAAETGFWVDLRREAFLAELRAAARVLSPSGAHSRTLDRHLDGEVVLLDLPLGSAPWKPVTHTPSDDGRLCLLHFGNLSRLKGLEELLAAVERADPDGTRIRLVLAGELLEDGLDLGRAEVHGAYVQEDLERLAAEADVAVFPSLARESHGMVVDEALRLGLPVIVSERGALAERIGGRGVRVPAGNVEALARQLRELLDHPELLDRWREGAAPALMSEDDHAAALDEIYAEARERPLPEVDVQRPLLQRIGRSRERLRDVLDLARRLRGEEERG